MTLSQVLTIQCEPVSSPEPLKLKIPAKQLLSNQFLRGRIVVTPVLTACTPSPLGTRRLSVWTSTPGTSVMEFRGPVGWRPIIIFGKTSRIRNRGLGAPALEVERLISGRC